MSLLGRITEKFVNFIGFNSDPQSGAVAKDSKAPLPLCVNVGENIDSWEPSQNSKELKKQIDDFKNNIMKQLSAAKLEPAEMFEIVSAITGVKDEKEFSQLQAKHQIMVLSLISDELAKISQNQAKYGKSKTTGLLPLVMESAKNKYEAVETGAYATVEELHNAAGNVYEELGGNFSQQNLEENAKKRFDNYLKDLEAQLAKCKTKGEKELLKSQLEQRRKYAERVRYNDIIATGDSRRAIDAIVTLSATDMDYGANVALSTRCNDEERTKTADMADFEHFTYLMGVYNKRGELTDENTLQVANAVKAYNSVTVRHKTYDAVIEYQEDYVRARESGQLDYMPQEVITATAQGVGQGALINVNMNSEEKGKFLATWDRDASKFSDYELVTSKVKSEIAKNSEIAKTFNREVENIKNTAINKKTDEKSNGSDRTSFDLTKEELSESKTSVSNPFILTASKMKSNDNDIKLKKDNVKIPDVSNNIPKQYVTNPAKIAEVLDTVKSLDEAKKFCTETALIKVVLSDTNKYKTLLNDVLSKLESGGETYLAYVVNSSGDKVILTLCRELGKDKIEPLIHRELCYTVENEIENMG